MQRTTTESPAALLRRAAFLAAIAATCCLAGCNIVTPVAYAIEGPGQIEAEFTLPDKKTVVFVDDPRNILPRTSLRTMLGEGVSMDLMQRELLSSTVSSRDAIAIARNRGGVDARDMMSNEAIAKALDCAQIIHIQPVIFDLAGRTDDRGIRPTAKVLVKVIDVENRIRSYPMAEALPQGREVTASIREDDPGSLRTRVARAAIEDELIRELAIEVAQLFYKHDRIDLGENLGTRRK